MLVQKYSWTLTYRETFHLNAFLLFAPKNVCVLMFASWKTGLVLATNVSSSLVSRVTSNPTLQGDTFLCLPKGHKVLCHIISSHLRQFGTKKPASKHLRTLKREHKVQNAENAVNIHTQSCTFEDMTFNMQIGRQS